MPMIPTPPIVLHLSKPDYSGTECGEGTQMQSFSTEQAAVRAAFNLGAYVCETCRRQAAKEREHETE